MNILLIILITFLGIVILVSAIGFTMPSEISFSESINIQKPSEDIFPYLSDFEQFVIWSPWSEKDPNMKQTFEGEKMSFGHKYSWSGNSKVGKGSMEIQHIEVNQKVDILLNFGPRGNSDTGFVLSTENGSTKVEWIFKTNLGSNPAARLFGPLMRKFVQKDFSHGLQKLKTILEK